MRFEGFLVFAALLGAAVAGCVGGNNGASARDGDPAPPSGVGVFGEGSGVLRGQVVDAELMPVEGAMVQVDTFDPLRTDAAGGFEALGLEPGNYVVHVSALGYTGASRTVRVLEDAVTQEQFMIERLPSQDPRLDVLHFRGTSVCDYMIYVFTGRLNLPGCEAQENRFEIVVEEGWQFLVVEQVWRPTTGLDEWFRVFTSDDSSCTDGSPCYGLVYGDGYARLEGEPGKTEMVEHYDPWGDNRGPPYPEVDGQPGLGANFTMVVNSQWIGMFVEEGNSLPGDPCQVILQSGTGTHYKRGCVGFGVSTGVTFDLWVSVFHWHRPADVGACCPATEYTALPDQ